MFNNIWGENISESCTRYCTIIYPTSLFGKKFILKFVPIFGKKFLMKALLHIITIKYPTLLFGKKFILTIVPICGENIFLKGVLNIFTIVYHTFMFGKKFIPKIVSIFGQKTLLKVYNLRRNLFRNLYQYVGENILLKGVFNIFTIVYHTFMLGKKFILKRLPNIWEENSSSSCTRYCYHYMSYVYIWEEIYSEICSNICEESSSESCY